MFAPRPLEADEDGNLDDGGPDPRFVERERRIADGRSEERDAFGRQAARQGRQDRQPLRADQAQGRRPPGADERHERAEDEPGRKGAQEPDEHDPDAQEPDEGEGAEAERGDAEGQSEQDAEGGEGERYEIEVDGQKEEVTLAEALKGYTREKTYQTRLAKLGEIAQSVDQQMGQALQMRDALAGLLRQQEQEFQAILPPEPNWDELFRQDPKGAHELQKNYRAVYGKLDAIRQRRAQVEAQAAADHERQTAAYARSEFTKFIQENRIENEGELKRELDYMRKTALAAGFAEPEIATVYDRRMLTILRKASKYDRMMANKPRPVIPGKGRSMAPGAAPRIGNGQRRTFDDSMKRLEQSGRLEDAEAVFSRMLR
jgi:hypothetical protein